MGVTLSTVPSMMLLTTIFLMSSSACLSPSTKLFLRDSLAKFVVRHTDKSLAVTNLPTGKATTGSVTNSSLRSLISTCPVNALVIRRKQPLGEQLATKACMTDPSVGMGSGSTESLLLLQSSLEGRIDSSILVFLPSDGTDITRY